MRNGAEKPKRRRRPAPVPPPVNAAFATEDNCRAALGLPWRSACVYAARVGALRLLGRRRLIDVEALRQALARNAAAAQAQAEPEQDQSWQQLEDPEQQYAALARARGLRLVGSGGGR